MLDFLIKPFSNHQWLDLWARWLALLILSVALPSLVTSSQAQTPGSWYVRPDGGDRIQCTGKADARYSGSGSNQPCAFKHPFYLFTDNQTQQVQWIIASGDTVIIKNGSYRIGQGTDSETQWLFCGEDPSLCGIRPPPSGTTTAHTQILGEAFAACTTKPELWGASIFSVIGLKGSSFVDIGCLEITDHANCDRETDTVKGCNDATPPLDLYADVGIDVAGGSNIFLTDLDLHGLGYSGIKGNPNGLSLLRVHVAGNAGSGIDFDTGENDPVSGLIKMSYVTVEWNGCVEQYPTKGLYGACTDENSGGYGDGVGTPDSPNATWAIDHSIFRFNTQDGLDLLHTTGSLTTVTDSAAYGNIGNEFKLGAASITFQNNYAISNCMSAFRIPHPGTTTPDYAAHINTDCRAEGTPLVFVLTPGSHSKVQNNSISGHSDILLYISCSTVECSAGNTSVNLDNNLWLGFNVVTPGNVTVPPQFPVSVFLGDGEEYGSALVPETKNYFASAGGSKKNNLYFRVRDRDLIPELADPTDKYADPLLVSENNVNTVDFHLGANSPAVNSGLHLASVVHDFDQNLRPGGFYTIGAFEPGAGSGGVPQISVTLASITFTW